MTQASQQLPIWLTLKTAYQFFFKNRKSFIRLAFPWCLLSTILSSLAEYLPLFSPLFASTLEGRLISGSFNMIEFFLDFFIIGPMLSILFIRCVALKKSFPKKSFYFSFTRKEGSYILYSLLFGLVGLVILGSFFVISMLHPSKWSLFICVGLGIIIVLLLGTRLRLVFLAIACGDNTTFLQNIRASWKTLKRSTLRFVAVTLLGILPTLPILLLHAIPLGLALMLTAILGKDAVFNSYFFPSISLIFSFLGTLIYWIVFYGITNCINAQVYAFKRQEMLSFLKEDPRHSKSS